MPIATLFVIAAPSGAGKTSLVNELLRSMEHIKVSVSFTTRPMRPGERQGVNYFFVNVSEFKNMVAEGVFLEHALVHSHYYGTSRQWVEEQLRAGTDVILEIDWQGAQQIRRQFPDCVSIFILPPSYEALKSRLLTRNQDRPEVIEQRLAAASIEMSHYREFEYLVINDVFETALADLQSIVRAGRLRTSIQARKYGKLLAELA